jgi:hypothetical protein
MDNEKTDNKNGPEKIIVRLREQGLLQELIASKKSDYSCLWPS